ncbi:hypothetical protein [Paraburkholderia sp. HD33-4]|uniref:hypothetical protein n=1 Tax=Paraburkholderia sp. HD33-4 TaxID=2883242 RepID=UPI001F2F91D0|nr:hypothetical protein [Paraburkholderia sp. HD33-4]
MYAPQLFHEISEPVVVAESATERPIPGPELMGVSRGGQPALYAGLKRFQQLHGSTSGKSFAGYIAFYPNCNTTYRAEDDFDDKPVRVFHGSADDYAPVASCRAYVERLRAKGKDIKMIEYSGA